MSGVADGEFADVIAQRAMEAWESGNIGLWLLYIGILEHINPASGIMQKEMASVPVSRFLEVSSLSPGSLYWQLMSMYVAAQASHHGPLRQTGQR